jgi:hypothetical protein
VLAALLAVLSAGGVGGPRRPPTVTINASCTARVDFCGYNPT